MSDPFLFGPPTEPPEPIEKTATAPATDPESGLRQILLEAGFPEDAVDRRLQRDKQRLEIWEPVGDAVARTLLDAGFHRHDPFSAGGGFHINCLFHDDGVLVSWAIRRPVATTEIDDPYEIAVEHIMNPALRDVLTAAGYTTQLIPSDDEYSPGYVLVTAGPNIT